MGFEFGGGVSPLFSLLSVLSLEQVKKTGSNTTEEHTSMFQATNALLFY